MKVQPPFKLYLEAPKSLIDLLEGNYLGSNGARYLHLDIKEKLRNLECPVHLCLERNSKVIANVTLDKRPIGWYVRYFAFDLAFQAKRKNIKEGDVKKSFLKECLLDFFNQILDEVNEESASLIYAYIDSKNVNSKWFANEMGFQKIATVKTQTFSRLYPKARIDITERFEQEQNIPEENLKNLNYTYNRTKLAKSYAINLNGVELISCSVYLASWKFESLPGRFGNKLVKILPYTPFLRKLIQPKSHQFIVVENVNFRKGGESLLEDFLETILSKHNRNSILWWVDGEDAIYKNLSKKNWGILHRLLGVSDVDLCVKTKSIREIGFSKKDFYVSGYDLM